MATLKAGFTAVGDPERVAHRARSGHAARCAPRESVANSTGRRERKSSQRGGAGCGRVAGHAVRSRGSAGGPPTPSVNQALRPTRSRPLGLSRACPAVLRRVSGALRDGPATQPRPRPLTRTPPPSCPSAEKRTIRLASGGAASETPKARGDRGAAGGLGAGPSETAPETRRSTAGQARRVRAEAACEPENPENEHHPAGSSARPEAEPRDEPARRSAGAREVLEFGGGSDPTGAC
jgi:hypothetical protein